MFYSSRRGGAGDVGLARVLSNCHFSPSVSEVTRKGRGGEGAGGEKRRSPNGDVLTFVLCRHVCQSDCPRRKKRGGAKRAVSLIGVALSFAVALLQR